MVRPSPTHSRRRCGQERGSGFSKVVSGGRKWRKRIRSRERGRGGRERAQFAATAVEPNFENVKRLKTNERATRSKKRGERIRAPSPHECLYLDTLEWISRGLSLGKFCLFHLGGATQKSKLGANSGAASLIIAQTFSCKFRFSVRPQLLQRRNEMIRPSYLESRKPFSS